LNFKKLLYERTATDGCPYIFCFINNGGDVIMSLIINGDDYGLRESCSLAIAEAIREGLITHTTMMSTGEYFEEAIRLAAELGFTDKIGVHLNLTEGSPLTDIMRNTPAFVRDGLFHKAYLKKPRELTDSEQTAVKAELSAQIEMIKSKGIPVFHADSHHNIHLYKPVTPLAAEVCKNNNIKRIRINRTFSTPERPIISGLTDNSRWIELGFETTSYFGRMSDLAQVIHPDDTEIMVHPDYDRNGVLIDRRGVADGYPFGDRLTDIKALFKA
jgi:predicted glycoside hydrolase/deacetylase ChbG (UPF0249 family)